jgi:RNase P subunit RPR2
MEIRKMSKLVCKKCGIEMAMPMHCGQEMHQEGNQLVCWMGAECGHQAIPKHHGAPMAIKA